MSDAEKVIKYVKRWTKEWEAEVEGMAPEVLATGAGANVRLHKHVRLYQGLFVSRSADKDVVSTHQDGV